jgi:hypothetical protein
VNGIGGWGKLCLGGCRTGKEDLIGNFVLSKISQNGRWWLARAVSKLGAAVRPDPRRAGRERSSEERRKTHTDECDILTPVIPPVEERREQTSLRNSRGAPSSPRFVGAVDVREQLGVNQLAACLSKRSSNGGCIGKREPPPRGCTHARRPGRDDGRSGSAHFCSFRCCRSLVVHHVLQIRISSTNVSIEKPRTRGGNQGAAGIGLAPKPQAATTAAGVRGDEVKKNSTGAARPLRWQRT